MSFAKINEFHKRKALFGFVFDVEHTGWDNENKPKTIWADDGIQPDSTPYSKWTMNTNANVKSLNKMNSNEKDWMR